MAHLSEAECNLEIERITGEIANTTAFSRGSNDVWLVALARNAGQPFELLGNLVNELGQEAIVAVLTSPVVAARLLPELSAVASFQLWVAVKLDEPITTDSARLPEHHAALLVFSKYRRSLRHTKTRIGYTFCP